jgi:hypothetical protein
MTSGRSIVLRSMSLAVGALLAAGIASPAFAARFDMPVLSPPDYLLGGLLLLLVVALVVRIARRHEMEETPPAAGPDMRWWKQPQM